MFDKMNKYFSDKEIHLTHKFIEKMGIDFAEIDILRDNSTGLMYIVDVNPVPSGGLLNLIGEKNVKKLAYHFRIKHLK